jgi:hypothetical protein
MAAIKATRPKDVVSKKKVDAAKTMPSQNKSDEKGMRI